MCDVLMVLRVCIPSHLHYVRTSSCLFILVRVLTGRLPPARACARCCSRHSSSTSTVPLSMSPPRPRMPANQTQARSPPQLLLCLSNPLNLAFSQSLRSLSSRLYWPTCSVCCTRRKTNEPLCLRSKPRWMTSRHSSSLWYACIHARMLRVIDSALRVFRIPGGSQGQV